MVQIKKGKVIARSAKKTEKSAPEPAPKSLTSEELDGVVGGAMVAVQLADPRPNPALELSSPAQRWVVV